MVCQLKFAVNQLNFISKFTNSKKGQQKRATCFATLLQNELHSDVARFIACITGFLWSSQARRFAQNAAFASLGSQSACYTRYAFYSPRSSLSCNKSGCWWCVNTDFWLNEIVRDHTNYGGIHSTQGLQNKIASAGAGKTRNMYRFCCNKWNYALFSATTFRNLQQSDLLQDRFDSRMVKRATSLFSSHSSNVVKQFELFFPVLPYLYV